MKFISKILILTSIVSLSSCKKCKKDEEKITPTEETPPVESLSATTPGYLKFTLGSVNYSYSASTSGFWFSGTPTFSTQTSSPNYYSQSNNYNSSSTTNVFLLTKKDAIIESGPKPSATYFRNFLNVQNYVFASTLTAPLTNSKGIYIKLKDNTNTYWYSINPVNSTSFQTASSFSIIEKFEFVEVAPSTTMKFKANFNCKLYNSVGDSIMLTNGETITSYSNT